MTALRVLMLFSFLVALQGCYAVHPSNGGGQISNAPEERRVEIDDVLAPDGYKIEVLAKDLTFPVGVTFDEQGTMYVLESGYAYGEIFTTPRLLKIEGGRTTVLAQGDNPPWTGVSYKAGYFYISEGGQKSPGRILRVDRHGNIDSLLEGLPSLGDHHTNKPLPASDGYLYFLQGTATNSGVVGEDSAQFGWLMRHPEFSDVACKDLVLTGKNFESRDVLKQSGTVRTGAFSSFGQKTRRGTVIKGRLPCTGSIMRIPLEGGRIDLVAWGLRNPFGIVEAEDGSFYVTENGYDIRGSRPVFGSGDYIWKIASGKHGTWYGWPDYAGGLPLTDRRFTPVAQSNPGRVLESIPNDPPQPIAILGVHSSANGVDIAPPSFGYGGELFVALFGDMAPDTGSVYQPVGFKVVRVEPRTGVIRDFLANRGNHTGPASWSKNSGLERPVDVQFNPVDGSLHVVDFGVLQMTAKGPNPKTGTGVIWRVSKVEESR